jgi:hypothetical protein
VRRQGTREEKLSTHDDRQVACRSTDPGGGGSKPTRDMRMTVNSDTNLDAYLRRVNRYPMVNAIGSAPGELANPDMNPGQASCHPVASLMRLVPAPRWCPRGLTKTQCHHL